MSMSIEKVIEILDSRKAPETEQDFEDFDTAIETAVNLLKTYLDNQPNDPLTLAELREMNGGPVWVETPGVDREISGRWVIVDGVNLEKKVLFTRGDFTCHDYGKVWLAYRRKPEEGAT